MHASQTLVGTHEGIVHFRDWMLRFIPGVLILVLAAFVLSLPTARPAMVLNLRETSSGEMLSSASHVFIGVIRKHQFEPSLPVIAPAERSGRSYWKVIRREILV